jgi:hypothetical protein
MMRIGENPKMKKSILLLMLALVLASCSPAAVPTPVSSIAAGTVFPTVTPLPTLPILSTDTPTPTETLAPTLTSTPGYPLEGYGPGAFPAGVDPLTGLKVLELNLIRRPLIIKVENLPQNHRPQYGLSQADLVFEYYTEEGSTRFAAVFFGQDAEKVAPIRSARYFDINLVQMYKANFVFGGAYDRLYRRLFNTDFSDRLIVEGAGSCPALCRFDPNGSNLLMANTAGMADYLKNRSMDNTPRDLEGMLFQAQVPANGQPVQQVFTRFSGAIYNRWDYDAASGRYLRFSDAQDDISRKNEVYSQLFDKGNGQPIGAENLVIILAPYFQADPAVQTEVMDVKLTESGPAYLFRDGQVYPLKWQRAKIDSILTLVNEDGTPFPFKPGNTWFEVMGSSTKIETQDTDYHFIHVFP